MKRPLLVLLTVILLGAAWSGGQSQGVRPTDDQLEILGLQADVQKCQVDAEKKLRKLQAQIEQLKKEGSK